MDDIKKVITNIINEKTLEDTRSASNPKLTKELYSYISGNDIEGLKNFIIKNNLTKIYNFRDPSNQWNPLTYSAFLYGTKPKSIVTKYFMKPNDIFNYFLTDKKLKTVINIGNKNTNNKNTLQSLLETDYWLTNTPTNIVTNIINNIVKNYKSNITYDDVKDLETKLINQMNTPTDNKFYHDNIFTIANKLFNINDNIKKNTLNNFFVKFSEENNNQNTFVENVLPYLNYIYGEKNIKSYVNEINNPQTNQPAPAQPAATNTTSSTANNTTSQPTQKQYNKIVQQKNIYDPSEKLSPSAQLIRGIQQNDLSLVKRAIVKGVDLNNIEHPLYGNISAKEFVNNDKIGADLDIKNYINSLDEKNIDGNTNDNNSIDDTETIASDNIEKDITNQPSQETSTEKPMVNDPSKNYDKYYNDENIKTIRNNLVEDLVTSDSIDKIINYFTSKYGKDKIITDGSTNVEIDGNNYVIKLPIKVMPEFDGGFNIYLKEKPYSLSNLKNVSDETKSRIQLVPYILIDNTPKNSSEKFSYGKIDKKNNENILVLTDSNNKKIILSKQNIKEYFDIQRLNQLFEAEIKKIF
jgi:hypothetical protein